MIRIKMPNGSILATVDKAVAKGYIKYGGGEIIKDESKESPKARRGRKPKEPVSGSSN